MEMYDKAYMNCYMFENDKLDLCEKRKHIHIFLGIRMFAESLLSLKI